MPHQPLITALATAPVTGSHPGPAYYVAIALIIGAIVGVPVYVARLVRDRRRRR